MDIVDVYTDGGFHSETVKWAFVIVENGKQIHQGSGRLPKKYNDHRQIGGEIMAVVEAVSWAKLNGHKLNIFHDYNGLHNWVADLCEPYGKPWMAKKEVSQKYRDFISRHKAFVNKFVWVKGHSGDKWNDYVDSLLWES